MALAQRIGFLQIRLIARSLRKRGAATVHFHIAAASQKKHPVDGEFHIGIIADVPVGT